jgi:hypothetical protein
MAAYSPAEIRNTTTALEQLYSARGYSRPSSLYLRGRVDGIITEKEYEDARYYYANLWNAEEY